jgi:lysylphosphatidylglycerol synthetase-like protein (DUF2156 family)
MVERSRPWPVSIVAAFLFAATVIAVVVGVSLLFPNRLLDALWKLNPAGAVFFHSIGPISGVFLLVLGAAILASARGMLRGHKWAWWFAVALFAVEACSNLVSYFVIHDALRTVTGSVISFAFLCILCRRSVRDYFFLPGPVPSTKL